MLYDTELEKKIQKTLSKLERQVDRIGPRRLRQSMDEKVVALKNELRNFDEEKENEH